MTLFGHHTRARDLWLSFALVLCYAQDAAGATQTFVSAKGDDADPGHVYTFANNRLFGNGVNAQGKPSLIAPQF